MIGQAKPDHIPSSRLGNKAELAEFFGVALTTADQWLRRGCPYVQRGSRGIQWKFDFLDVAKWRYGSADDNPDEDPEKMPPKDRLDWYKGSREKMKHMEESGDLVPAAVFEAELAAVLKKVAVTMESLPDVLERDADIDGAAVERVQLVTDRMRNELYENLISAPDDG